MDDDTWNDLQGPSAARRGATVAKQSDSVAAVLARLQAAEDMLAVESTRRHAAEDEVLRLRAILQASVSSK